jgi:hypothetical protein
MCLHHSGARLYLRPDYSALFSPPYTCNLSLSVPIRAVCPMLKRQIFGRSRAQKPFPVRHGLFNWLVHWACKGQSPQSLARLCVKRPVQCTGFRSIGVGVYRVCGEIRRTCAGPYRVLSEIWRTGSLTLASPPLLWLASACASAQAVRGRGGRRLASSSQRPVPFPGSPGITLKRSTALRDYSTGGLALSAGPLR